LALEEAKSGLMTAIKDGATRWHRFPIRSWAHRKVEIASMYDTEHYRPQYEHKIGLPIFLTRSK
jgi:hypothetical protein